MENKVFDARQEGVLEICRPLRGLFYCLCSQSWGLRPRLYADARFERCPVATPTRLGF